MNSAQGQPVAESVELGCYFNVIHFRHLIVC